MVAATPSASSPTAKPASPAKRGVPTALIIIINAVILIAVIIVVLVMRKPQPTQLVKPAVPTAPKISAPALPK